MLNTSHRSFVLCVSLLFSPFPLSPSSPLPLPLSLSHPSFSPPFPLSPFLSLSVDMGNGEWRMEGVVVCARTCSRKAWNREKRWKSSEDSFRGHFQDSISIPPTWRFPPTPRSERTEIMTAYHWAQGHKAVSTENPKESNTQIPEFSFWKSIPISWRRASCPPLPNQEHSSGHTSKD